MSAYSSLHPSLRLIGAWLRSRVMELFQEDFVSLTAGLKRKQDGTYAGELDFAIADSCRNELGTHFRVVTEEDEKLVWPPHDGAPTILLDPLDGTHNHAMGSLDYGCMVALCEGGVTTAAVILLPAREVISHNGFYVAARGMGAYRYNSRSDYLLPIQVSDQNELANTTLVCEGSTRKQDASPILAKVVKAAARRRINLSAAWSGVLTAQGNLHSSPAHALVAVDNHPWDNLAPALLIEEAGGKVTDFQGQPWTLTTRNLLAANPNLHAAMLAVMRNEKE